MDEGRREGELYEILTYHYGFGVCSAQSIVITEFTERR